MKIGDVSFLYGQLARQSYGSGDFAKCLEFTNKLGGPLPPDLRRMASDASYRLGVQTAAEDSFGPAAELFSQACRWLADLPVRRLCQDRISLLKQGLRSGSDDEGCPLCVNGGSISSAKCLSPGDLQPEVDEVHCVAAYRSGYDTHRNDPFSQMIRRMKGADGTAFLDPAARLLAHFVAVHLGPSFRSQIDLIVPVPTSTERYADRGHVIPGILAGEVSRRTAIPVYPKLLTLQRDTPDLRGLNAAQRRQALAGAFALSDSELLDGFSVLVVDDVVTHGTTFKEIARLLRSVGAISVYGVALAHSESSERWS